jgi:hypothetical protein
MLNSSARRNRKIVLFAVATLVAGASIAFAQGGGAGGADGGAGGASGGAAVPAAPSTPSTTSSGGVTSPANEEASSATARSERRSKARSVHYHRGRDAGGALGSYYCGSSPCFRIYLPAIDAYAAPVPVVVAPPVYRASALWWPGYYDYAAGQWGRGRPRYGGYGRRAGYHGD